MEFFTIKEASDRTGKSVSTIRRLVRETVADNSHADRAQVQPSPADAKKLTAQGVQFAWKVSEELLLREFGSLTEHTEIRQHDEVASLSNILREELQSKENQLKKKDEQIEKLGSIVTSLNDRLREGNLLMAALQNQMQLPQQTAKTPIAVEAPEIVPTPEAETKIQKAKAGKQKAVVKITPTVKQAPVPAAKPRKRSWLAVIFG